MSGSILTSTMVDPLYDEAAAAGPASYPPLAGEIFGNAVRTVAAYADLLVTRGTEWGLLGPREASRIWERHLFNSAALAHRVAPGASVADVGSGAGLPGLPLAIARPDLSVTLIESLQRRAEFLRLAVEELGLTDRVVVAHQRAEQVRQRFDVVVSRAVAPLPTLIPWCLGLTVTTGEVLAMRGQRIDEEVADYLKLAPAMRARFRTEIVPAAGSDHPVRLVRVSP